jgi:cytochrome P450
VTAAPPESRPAPGPGHVPFVGNLPQIVSEGVLPFFLRCQQEYGDHFTVKMGKTTMHVLCRPEHAQRVLWTEKERYRKDGMYDEVRKLTGQGLLTLQDEPWKARRRLMQPSFHRRRILELIDAMVRCTQTRIEAWREQYPTGSRFDLHEEMMKLTLDVVGETLFGVDLSGSASESAHAFGDALTILGNRGNYPVAAPDWVPTPANRKLKRALQLLDDETFRVIAEARATEERAPTLLAMLLDAVDEETGEGLTDPELRNEVITLFLAGHETTALLLSWGVTLLTEQPDAEPPLHDEVERVLQGRAPDAASLRELDYTHRLVHEFLRLRSPVWSLGRDCPEGDVIDGVRIEPGDGVLPFVYAIHRHPDFWQDPERVDPDRWLNERRKARNKWAFLPFSQGERQCIGNQFSLTEAAIVLSMLSQVCRLKAVSIPDPNPAITYRPGGAIEVEITWV